jgi:hypothetical protein
VCSTKVGKEIVKGDILLCVSRVVFGVGSTCTVPASKGLKGFVGGEGSGDTVIGGSAGRVGDGGGRSGGVDDLDSSGFLFSLISCGVGDVIGESILTDSASVYCTTNDEFGLNVRVGIVGDAGSGFDVGGVDFKS